MKANELYYLLLVLAAFGTFALSMSLATIRYRAWLRHAEGQRRDVPAAAMHGVAHAA